jgi:hypothetical protein
MPSTRSFRELRKAIDDDPALLAQVEQERIEALREHVEYTLAEVRKVRDVTQVELAHRLGMNQPGVSRIEHQENVLIETLREYVEALGGRLELAAVFGEDDEERIPLAI